MLSHKTVQRESNNVVVCDEEEIVGGIKIKHRDRYTFHPKDRVTEEILEGPVSGMFDLRLTDTDEGTRIDWDFDVKAESLKFKIIGIFGGIRILQGVADEYCRQLAQFAESLEAGK
jgi:carbon monoxide dehydrogenase subunit G